MKRTAHTRLAVLLAVMAVVSTGCGRGAQAVPGQHSNFAGVRCPRRVPELTSHNSVRRGVVISDSATVLVVCRYSGERLLKQRRLSSPIQVARIIHEINALPPFPNGTVNCPSATGDEMVILPLRANRNIGTVEVELGGCFEVTNGVASKLGFGAKGPLKRAFRALEAPVPASP